MFYKIWTWKKSSKYTISEYVFRSWNIIPHTFLSETEKIYLLLLCLGSMIDILKKNLGCRYIHGISDSKTDQRYKFVFCFSIFKTIWEPLMNLWSIIFREWDGYSIFQLRTFRLWFLPWPYLLLNTKF